jgi:hypothetical protein
VGSFEVQQQRDKLVGRGDAAQQKLDRVLDMARWGRPRRGLGGPRIAALQVEIERFTVDIAALDGRLAAASMTETECDVLMAAAAESLHDLERQPYETQQKHLRAWVRQVRLSPEAIEADPYSPALVGQVCTERSTWLPGEDSNLRPDD